MYISFEGSRKIAFGELAEVARKTKEVLDRGERAPVLVFDDDTGEPVELDLRGPEPRQWAQTEAKEEKEEPRRPGRPRLGVVAREVTLLPRHWDWLNSQPGGASVALRKLVEEARRANAEKDRVRQAQEAAYRFVSAMAGNEPNYEEALRALFAGNAERFTDMTAPWPLDVREHACRLAARAFVQPAAVQP